jgi:glycosyltransferase involved in cell wall biosynthesis
VILQDVELRSQSLGRLVEANESSSSSFQRPKSHTPFVSIIVPVFNGAPTIGSCIEALLAQDYPPDGLEIIVVDNGSKDQTIDLLEPYIQSERIKLLSETDVLNAYGARNTGAWAARGDILAFTDADCLAERDWLVRLLEGFEDKSVGAFIGDILAFEPRTALERYYSDDSLSLRGKDVSSFPGMRAGNCAIRREVFGSLGGFRIMAGGDSEFLKRMIFATPYKFQLKLDSIVFHKNYDKLSLILRRGMRFGSTMPDIKGDPVYGKSYITWMANVRGIVIGLASIIYRFAMAPYVRLTGLYRGRYVTDLSLFLVEPMVRTTEMTGLMVGRIVRSRRFR